MFYYSYWWLRYNEPSDNTMKPGPGAYAAEKVIIKNVFLNWKPSWSLENFIKKQNQSQAIQKITKNQTFLILSPF